jgi:endonuclease G, mitochondrial
VAESAVDLGGKLCGLKDHQGDHMQRAEKLARLKKMLTQIAPGNALEALPRPGAEAIERGGFESLGPGNAAALESGLQKLAEDRSKEITPSEILGLEAIVLPRNRPVAFVRGESYDDLEEPWLNLNDDVFKRRIASLLPLIGRVEVPSSPILPYAGTGFVVGRGLIATNRHVAQLFSQGLGLTIRYRAGDAAIDFKRQIDAPDDDRAAYLSVRAVEMIHPYWDMALLRVDDLPTGHVLRLSVKSPEELLDHKVVVIGYPARDDRSDLPLQDRVFNRTYNVKRLQPGFIRARVQIQSFENNVNAMTHDASTLGGNSGSAVIDIDSGDVVALHFAGEYLKANYAVPMCELARDSRVAPLLNFEGTLPPTNDWAPAWRSVERTEGSGSAAAPPQPSPPSIAVQLPSSSTDVTAWTIPLRVSVAIGRPSTAFPQPADTAVDQILDWDNGVAEEAIVVDPDYSNRSGYDPSFLETVDVPLPRVSKAMEQDTARVRSDAQKNDDPFELAYYHYSVYMNKRRRTAWFSAANVDGDHRPNIGKRRGDRWYTDPRIQRSEQIGQEAFERGIDRGHLTRREDTAWGSDVASATLANNDTFHFTNCSLQASPFNQGKDRWQGLERFLLEQHAKKERRRLVVITGPLFAANDPVYKNDRMNYSVRCPLQFWKVCVLIKQDGTPSATAFVLGQEDIQNLPGFEETFDVAAAQISLADLEERTGLDFGNIKKFDHFAAGGVPGTLELPGGVEGVTRRARIVRNGSDIVV